MLKKMIIHGLVAAALIGTAAAVYAESRDSGYLSPNTASTPATEIGSRAAESNGYLSNDAQRKESHKSYFWNREHDDDEGMEHSRKHGKKHDDD